jgi:hypothetical protein
MVGSACARGNEAREAFEEPQVAKGDAAPPEPPPPPTLAPATFDDFGPPIIDGSAPKDAGQQLGAAKPASSGGPCLSEPELGTLFPRNWLRPRFAWTAMPGQNLYELRVHVDNQKNDLLVYTTSTRWTMPKAMWEAVSLHSNDMPMNVTVTGASLSGGKISKAAIGSKGDIRVAPAQAPGSVVYWSTADNGSLKGFSVGEESVGPVLTPAQIKQRPVSACIGCHAATPDGEFTVMSTPSAGYGNVVARIAPGAGGAVGDVPTFLSPAAKTTLEQGPLGISAFSRAHWGPGDRVMIASSGNDLVWIDLEASTAGLARGTIARQGMPAPGARAGSPAWSHDGNTIAYVATNHYTSGRLGTEFAQNGAGAVADIYTVPYNDRAGGAATPVAGAADPSMLEFYPAFSPDDAMLTYVRAPNGTQMYSQKSGEVFVVPAAGGTATRLAGNDPPACTSRKSPGVTNSWPSWAPNVEEHGGRKYYWVVFSSTRRGTEGTSTVPEPAPQLYLAPVVLESSGDVTTYAALYIWNQPEAEGNHSPSWENFQIPPSPPPK